MPNTARDFLYKIMYEITTVFESSKTAQELCLGLKQVFRSFFQIKDLTIYTEEKGEFKNFIKPWENITEENLKSDLNKYYEDIKKNNKNYVLTQNAVYFPIFKQRKINGIALIEGVIDNDTLENIMPLLTRQVSLALVHLEYYEGVKNNALFYETIRNITKITETQYDLNYILPIMGEMIDRFISCHLIYVFLKNKTKKEYRLIWPNKCLIKNIDEYLSEINENKAYIKDSGKTCIFPLMENNKPKGAIVAYNPVDVLTQNEINYLEQISTQASITVSKAQEYMKILKDATLDALTGLNNRHQFHQRLVEEIANAKRQKTDLCCIMTDIDFFKSVNDTYGHAVGDLVLKTAAKTIKKELRQYDIPSRYGGEEFAILLPNTPLNEAMKAAERLREKIEKKIINIEEFKLDKKEISITISLGVSKYDEKTMKEPEELYRLADKGLYEAKETGRNKVVSFCK